MRRILFAVSVAVTALSPSALADHRCVEVSGAVSTAAYLGECEFSAEPEHFCHLTETSLVTIEVCLPLAFGYANTAR